jgi:hypothetical protein
MRTILVIIAAAGLIAASQGVDLGAMAAPALLALRDGLTAIISGM